MSGRFLTGLGLGGLIYAGLSAWPAAQRGEISAAVFAAIVGLFVVLLVLGLRRSRRG